MIRNHKSSRRLAAYDLQLCIQPTAPKLANDLNRLSHPLSLPIEPENDTLIYYGSRNRQARDLRLIWNLKQVRTVINDAHLLRILIVGA